MTETRPSNPFVAFLRFCWRALDFSRRLVLNAIFLLILVIFFAAIASGVPKLQPKTALLLAPHGDIVEQYTANPADRAFSRLVGDEQKETQLRDIIRALDAAAKDPMIEHVVFVPDEINSAGMSTIIEVGEALDRFRASGKKVYAYADGMDQRGYLMAAHADKIYLNPDGAVLLEGIGRYRTYFKGAFDKLGVEARLFRVGEYKSAGEPYIRSDQSPEAREADLYWMGDLWQRYLADVAKLRKLDADYSDRMFVQQLICLRLAVILCHARRDPDLQGMLLERQAAPGLTEWWTVTDGVLRVGWTVMPTSDHVRFAVDVPGAGFPSVER